MEIISVVLIFWGVDSESIAILKRTKDVISDSSLIRFQENCHSIILWNVDASIFDNRGDKEVFSRTEMRKKENESAENNTEDEEWAKPLEYHASDAGRSKREGEG